MESLFKIHLNYKKNYSFGVFHSGFALFDSVLIENLSDRAFSALKLQFISSPNIFLSAEHEIEYIAPGGCQFLSCDFVGVDASFFAAEKKIRDVAVTVSLNDSDGELLERFDCSISILPYFYFSGLGYMPETAAFFVTPSQPELERIKVCGSTLDPLDHAGQIYDNIKDLRITFVQEDYSGAVSLPVRLCERVIKERSANSFELSLLFASALEQAGFSVVIAFSSKGKFYSGFVSKESDLPFFSDISTFSRGLDGLFLIESGSLAFGSSLNFDAALFHTKNELQLTSEKITVFSIDKARQYHILSLPVRISEKGNYILSDKEEEVLNQNFQDYDLLWKDFSEDSRVKSILLGGKFAIEGKKTSIPFQTDLDVNQNKVLNKILSNNFTLIRAQTGTGVSTLFSRACVLKLKDNRNVLYITDPDYHPDDFAGICSKSFDSGFVWNILKDSDFSCYKDDFKASYSVDESVFEDRETIRNSLEKLNDYYAHLEGGKSVVSSFLVASDRYDQLRDANDTIIFSPEQVGALSDEMVQSWFSTVNEIIKSVGEIGSVHQNPLLLVKNKNFSYEFKSKFIRHTEDFLRCIEQIISLRDQILPLFPSIGSLSAAGTLNVFCDLFRLFVDFEKIPELIFNNPQEIEANFRQATSLIQAKEENDSILQAVRVSFFESVFELDAEDLYTRYNALVGDNFIKALSQKHGILKAVKRYLKPNCDVENIEYILSRLYKYQKNAELIENTANRVFSLFSISDPSDTDCWKKLSFTADLCYQCYAVYQSSFDPDKLPGFVSDFVKANGVFDVSDKVNVLKDLCAEFSVLKRDLEKLVFNEFDFYFPVVSAEDYFSRLYQNVTELLTASDHLKNWCNWLSVKDRAISLGLKSVIIAIENGKISNDEIKRSFLRAFFKAVCEFNFIVNPELIPENFSVEQEKERFLEASVSCKSKEKTNLDSVLSMARFEGLREISAPSFQPSQLIENRNVFSSVFPCVISDLKQAKKLFSGQRNLFDLILLESRSSVSLNDLIWLFYTGKQVAFAGNFADMNVPRSSGFNLSGSAFDYLWNVTDEKYSLSATYFSCPSMTNFKNSFYSNLRSDFRYYTIPSHKSELVTEWRVLPGSFGGEYPGANYYEAQCAIDELISFAMSETKKSIGIIASTVEQKKLILRLFAQKLRHQEDVARYFTDYSRFYITSVGETLYPCDYVIFSATFSSDRSMPGSKLPDSFLEFGGSDPFKAIGSVISSAREKLLVLSSFRETELKATPVLLYSSFAFHSLFSALSHSTCNNAYRVIGTSDEVSIVKRLRVALETRGFKTISGIQSGRYYVDLGVLDDEGTVILGILTDHSVMSHHSNVAALECANAKYFEKYGWVLYRLRSASCFDSFDHELQNILKILHNDGQESQSF